MQAVVRSHWLNYYIARERSDDSKTVGQLKMTMEKKVSGSATHTWKCSVL